MESKHLGMRIRRPQWANTSWNASVYNVQQVTTKDINAKEKGIKVTAENSNNIKKGINLIATPENSDVT